MLEKNPEDRISAEQALNHPYFTGEKLQKKEIDNVFNETK